MYVYWWGVLLFVTLYCLSCGHCSVLLVEYWNSWYVLEYIVVCIVEFIGMYWHGMYCGIYCFWYLLQVLVCICMY